MVPLLTYAVRLPPKKEELDPGSMIPGIVILFIQNNSTVERTMNCVRTGNGKKEAYIETSHSRHCRLLSKAQGIRRVA